ncbi:hypothetical protein N7470_007629 [Penicillium chermesinum]|nr:hypothetical protein N7470_007629 [Penicillium chermesinum]
MLDMLKTPEKDLQLEIAQLEARLGDLRSQLHVNYTTPLSSHLETKSPWTMSSAGWSHISHIINHFAHPPSAAFHRFLKLSIASIASTSLPYVLAGYRHPETLETLDNDLDASTPCIVAQRASVAQGRALIGVWERAFRASFAAPGPSTDAGARVAAGAIDDFADALKSNLEVEEEYDTVPKGHFAPLWGVVCRAMGLDLQQTAYIFVLNHAKAVLSAAVRASVMGPYQAQNILASQSLQDTMMGRIKREWDTQVRRGWAGGSGARSLEKGI